jgi:poly(3-hydroxybutyrate) depolymerase
VGYRFPRCALFIFPEDSEVARSMTHAPDVVPSRSLRARKLIVTAAMLTAVAVALLLPLWRASPRLYGAEDAEIAPHAYAASEPAACAAASRDGPAGNSRFEATPLGLRYMVKTPANYDPTRAHPLLVVYAPHGANRFLSERYVGLTRAATAAGFILVYADSHPLDRATIEDLRGIPDRVAARWCVDRGRIYFTGHSDGGTAATAITVLGKSRTAPAAIAPSAAGFRREDLTALACPPPVSVMVLHSRNDELFPSFGREAAEWWAACNGCGSVPAQRPDGCLVFPDCRPRRATLYCEGDGKHLDWPNRNQAMLEFFRSTSRK